jgi:hypothetical protein
MCFRTRHRNSPKHKYVTLESRASFGLQKIETLSAVFPVHYSQRNCGILLEYMGPIVFRADNHKQHGFTVHSQDLEDAIFGEY